MILRKAISFLVYTNIWISVGAASFAWLYYQLSGTDLDWTVLLFLFFSTLLTYTFQRYEKISKKEMFKGPRMEWMFANKHLVKVLMLIGLFGSIAFSIYLSISSLIILVGAGAISFLYAYKFNLLSKRTNLRDIPGIKIYLIGLVWAISCGLIPFIESGIPSYENLMLLAGFFFYIIGITIPFDIRDVSLDEYSKRTIPQQFGVRSAKLIALVILLISYVMMVYPAFLNLALVIPFLLTFLLVLFTNQKRNELYFSFFIDGLLVILPGIHYLLHNL